MAEIFTAFGMNLDTPGTERTPERFLQGALRRHRRLRGRSQAPDGVPDRVPLRRRLSGQPDHRRADLLLRALRAPSLPFHGFAHVGYVAHERIIGISKLTRLVRLFSRRFTVQERLGEQVADALAELMEPHGVAVHIEAVHLCTQMRGVREEHSKTVTSVWRGGYTEQPGAAARVPRRSPQPEPLDVTGEGEARNANHRSDRRRRPDRRRRLQGHPRASTPTGRSCSSRGAASAVRAAAALEGALEGRCREHDLARHRGARRRPAPRPADRRARPRANESRPTTRARRYGYEKLLLATGGRPRRLPFGGDEVIYFRTLDDYRHLRALADGGARFVRDRRRLHRL